MTSPYTIEQGVLISNNNSSSSSTTGSLILYGGLGVAENINIAGISNFNTVNSSGLITGNSGLNITGSSTLHSISGTNLSLSNNLSVTGDSVFNQITSTTSILNDTTVTSLSGTNATFSHYVSVTGLITGNNGLSITGTSSLSAVTLTTLSGTSASFSTSISSNTLTVNSGITTSNLTISGILTNNNTTEASGINSASSVFNGGISVAKQLMSGSKVLVNYNGNALSSQLLIFPGISNGESSLLFNEDIPGFGSNWKIGHNINSTGSDTFSIFSETLNTNVFSSDNTGYITIPGTINSGNLITSTITASNISLKNVTIRSGMASTYFFTLPSSIGSSGQVLTSSGSNSPFTWTTPITSIQVIVPDFLQVSPNNLTANGTFTISYSGTPLRVLDGGTGSTTSTGSGSVTLNNSPMLITPNIGSATGTSLSVSNDVTINNATIQSNSGNKFNFNLPSTSGSSGQVLTSKGGGSNNMIWSDQYSPTKIIFSGSNNVSSFTDITGLLYTSGGFEITIIVTVIATNNLSQLFKLTGLYSANALAGWYFSSQSITGDNTSVSFNLTNMGQVQYTSGNYPGFVSLTINCYQIFNYN